MGNIKKENMVRWRMAEPALACKTLLVAKPTRRKVRRARASSFFHRGRVSLISSQVSSMAPELTGRWTNNRRLALAWRMLRLVRPSGCITHRFPLSDAPSAYALIDASPGATIQVVFDYGT